MKNLNLSFAKGGIYVVVLGAFLMSSLPATATHNELIKDKSSQKLLNRKQLETELGRKLTVKERLAVIVLKRSFKKSQKIGKEEKPSKKTINAIALTSAISGGISSGLVLALLGGIFVGSGFWFVLVLLSGVTAIVTGISSLVTLDRTKKRSRSYGLLGLILGSAVLLYILSAVIWFLLFFTL